MPLTNGQKTTLKNDIAVNTNTIAAGKPFAGTQVKDIPNSADGNIAIADWYSGTASPAYLVWRTDCDAGSIRAATSLAAYTPSDTPPASGGTVQITNDELLYQNRALICQLKQANAIFLLQSQVTLNCTPSNLRQSFSDCMRQIPSGGGGANNDAGWGAAATPGAVRLAMQRACRFIEKLLAVTATGAGNEGAQPRGSDRNPDALGYEGAITGQDVEDARNS